MKSYIKLQQKVLMQDSSEDSEGNEVGFINNSFQSISPELKAKYPYNCIGMLVMKHFNSVESRTATGTGFFISEDEVLTVAHNVIDVLRKGQLRPSQIEFLVFDEQGKKEKYQIIDHRVHLRYQRNINRRDRWVFDFALLKTRRKAVRSKFLKLDLNFNYEKGTRIACPVSQINQKMLQVYGYRTSKNSKQELEMEFCSASLDQSIKILKKSILVHFLSTQPGFSGAPIIYNGSVIAIHKSGQIIEKKDKQKEVQSSREGTIQERKFSNQQAENSARMITSKYKEYDGDIIHHLHKWSHEMNRQRSDNIFAKIYKFPREDTRKSTFWDFENVQIKDVEANAEERQETIILQDFTIRGNIVKKHSSNKLWRQLVSRNKMEENQAIYIKDIDIAYSGSLCVGFICQNHKKNKNYQEYDGRDLNSIGIMIRNQKNQLKFSLWVSNQNRKQWISQGKTDLIIKFMELDSANKKQSKERLLIIERNRIKSSKKLKGTGKEEFKESLSVLNFDTSLNYYLFVNTNIPYTSAYIQL